MSEVTLEQLDEGVKQLIDLLVRLDKLDARLAEGLESVVSLLYLDSKLSYVVLGLTILVVLILGTPPPVRTRLVACLGGEAA